MIKFLLGVADVQSSNAQVTQQDFTAFEKTMLEKTKDLQDIANSIQGDQISFLQDQISSFFTWAGIIITIAIAVITALSGFALQYIQRKSKEADAKKVEAAAKMDEATEKMHQAQISHEEAKDKISFLEKKQQELEELINSKALNDKINALEKSALLTDKLEKRAQSTVNIQTAKIILEDVIKEAKENEKFADLDPIIQDEIDKFNDECSALEFLLTQAMLQTNAAMQHPHLFNEEQVLGETKGVLSRALKLKKKAEDIWGNVIVPIIDRRKEKGE
ncbi:hypothetical protein ACLNAR_26370 [Priestia aryabhattai]|uniref:hypothetical protein n=1 Tax=Priestia aryabhattai TaxID=412384 RepID=UPI00398E34E4